MDEVEELIGRIQMNAETIRPTSSGISLMACQDNGTLAGTTIALPKIELPMFYEDVVQWCSFRDLFY